MFESIASKVTSTAIAIGSLFFASISGTNAVFTNPDIEILGNKIVVSASLDNCYTEELDRLFQSGQRVRFYFRVALVEEPKDKTVLVKDFYHQVRYNLVDNYYEIFLSETDITFTVTSMDEVHRLMARIENYDVIDPDVLSAQNQYHLKISAFMKNIRLPGMKDEIILMSYWKGVEPTLRSDSFDKSALAL